MRPGVKNHMSPLFVLGTVQFLAPSHVLYIQCAPHPCMCFGGQSLAFFVMSPSLSLAGHLLCTSHIRLSSMTYMPTVLYLFVYH